MWEAAIPSEVLAYLQKVWGGRQQAANQERNRHGDETGQGEIDKYRLAVAGDLDTGEVDED